MNKGMHYSQLLCQAFIRCAIAPIIAWRTGFPYSRLDAEQRFVGLRNHTATRSPPFFSLDLDVAKIF
ncbi:hypothetical protein WAJ73_24490, partial [Acinetobacter baumannii]